MEKIRVLLVDDQILFVESLKTVLETLVKDIEVVGIAHDGWEAINRAEDKRPQIILMDVRMPGMDGVEATRIIHGRFPEIHIIMLTTFDDDVYVEQALYHGAEGYLLKDSLPAELIASIRAIAHGAYLIAPGVAKKLIDRVYETAEITADYEEGGKDLPYWFLSLSKREKEVLSLIVRGFSNQEMSEKLFLARQTVKNYVSTIYSKLCAKDRTEIKQMVAKARLRL